VRTSYSEAAGSRSSTELTSSRMRSNKGMEGVQSGRYPGLKIETWASRERVAFD
jgi:hypothetical protein